MKERVLDTIPEDTIKNLTSVQEFSYCSFENCFSSLGRRKGLIHVFLSNRVRNTEPLEIAIKQAKSNLELSQIKLFKVISID